MRVTELDDAFRDLIGRFVESIAQTVPRLRADHASGNYDSIQVLAHQLKGAGAGHGYPGLTKVASHLEARIKAQMDPPALEKSIDDLIDYCEAIVAGWA